MTDLCSPEHARRLRELHARDPEFGVIGHRWAQRVLEYMQHTSSISLLDYGCGRSNLIGAVRALHARPPEGRYAFAEYDPATAPAICVPDPADFVSCIDVMEHVEADKVTAVLRDIRRCMRKGALITASLRNASPRNKATHPNVKPREWWLMKVGLNVGVVEEVPILDQTKTKSEVAMLVRPYETPDL